MKYPEGSKFYAPPVTDFQSEAWVLLTGFNSSFDESSMEPNVSYLWEGYDENGDVVRDEQESDAENFEQWVNEHAEEIDEFPWE